MTTNITPVQFSRLVEIATEAGLETEVKQSGWLKIKAKKGEGRVYLPVNKTGRVTRVDIAAIKLEGSDLVVPPRKPNGKVYHELKQVDLTESQILENFQLLCMMLAAD